MLKIFSQGFLLGIAYLAPIGMQNLYVINTAISQDRWRAYQVSFITVFFDISLALSCFYGMGMIMEKSEILKSGILLLGSIMVLYIGIQLLRSTPEVENHGDVNSSLMKVIVTCFTVTWMNPQALIDGALLLGGFRASLPVAGTKYFIWGVCIASLCWFTGITTIVSNFKSRFSTKIIKNINIISGLIIIYYGLKLGHSFMKMNGWMS